MWPPRYSYIPSPRTPTTINIQPSFASFFFQASNPYSRINTPVARLSRERLNLPSGSESNSSNATPTNTTTVQITNLWKYPVLMASRSFLTASPSSETRVLCNVAYSAASLVETNDDSVERNIEVLEIALRIMAVVGALWVVMLVEKCGDRRNVPVCFLTLGARTGERPGRPPGYRKT
jgi:hypothetical protein